MSVQYLSDDQVGRHGRFAEGPSVQELEEFFRLDTAALEVAATKRRPHSRLGWAVQWGTIRMLGTFPRAGGSRRPHLRVHRTR